MKKEKKDKIKCKEYEDLLKRLQAEFDNYRKRQEMQQANFIKFACSSLAAELLPFMDSLDKAVESNAELGSLREQFLSILKNAGIMEMQARDEYFNPQLHEVMLTENNEAMDEGMIIEVLQKGYMLHDKVLRHAKVKINRKTDNKNDKQENDSKTGK